jgi:hypothetical protein
MLLAKASLVLTKVVGTGTMTPALPKQIRRLKINPTSDWAQHDVVVGSQSRQLRPRMDYFIEELSGCS